MRGRSPLTVRGPRSATQHAKAAQLPSELGQSLQFPRGAGLSSRPGCCELGRPALTARCAWRETWCSLLRACSSLRRHQMPASPATQLDSVLFPGREQVPGTQHVQMVRCPGLSHLLLLSRSLLPSMSVSAGHGPGDVGQPRAQGTGQAPHPGRCAAARAVLGPGRAPASLADLRVHRQQGANARCAELLRVGSLQQSATFTLVGHADLDEDTLAAVVAVTMIGKSKAGRRLLEVRSSAHSAVGDSEALLTGSSALQAYWSRMPNLRWLHSLTVGCESLVACVALAKGGQDVVITNAKASLDS